MSLGSVFSLPPGITSIGLGECEHLEVDDAFLERVSAVWQRRCWFRMWLWAGAAGHRLIPTVTPSQIGVAFPALRHLSLAKTLVSEVKPAFRAPGVALARHHRALRHGALLALPSLPAGGLVAAKGASARSAGSQGSSSGSYETAEEGEFCGDETGENEGDEDSTSDESDDGGADADFGPQLAHGAALPAAAAPVSWWEARHAARKASRAARWASAGLDALPPHTSVAGWAALLRGLPHGLFSLDARSCVLSFASYSLLCERVSELRAAKVLSPEATAIAASRRSIKAAARQAARTNAAAALMSGEEDEE